MSFGRLFAYALVAALVLGGAYLAWRHYTGLVDEKAALTGQLATEKQLKADALQATLEQSLANVELRAEIDRQNGILADREGKRQDLQRQRDSANEQLEALKSNPEAASWMAMRVPDAVVRVLRGEPAGAGPGDRPQNGTPARTGQPGPADPGATLRGIAQRGPGQVGTGPAGGAGAMQR